jgi:hypothetical protein
MRPLAEYGLRDWSRLRPLTHFLKTRRYRRINRAYVALPVAGGDLAGARAAMRDRQAMVTIAFNDAEATGWQIRLVSRYLPDKLHVVADNSIDDAAATRICGLCRSRRLPYLRLPPIGWRRAAGSRSHGLALNWVWTNLVLPARPQALGFLDHDLFPTTTDDPFRHLSRQDFYGYVRSAGERWFLWAGYCFFRFDRVCGRPLDFGQDWFKGLDTGGGNWEVLYRRVERAGLAEATHHQFPYRDGLPLPDAAMERIDSWLHEVGTMGTGAMHAEKRRLVARLLAPHLADAPASPSTP